MGQFQDAIGPAPEGDSPGKDPEYTQSRRKLLVNSILDSIAPMGLAMKVSGPGVQVLKNRGLLFKNLPGGQKEIYTLEKGGLPGVVEDFNSIDAAKKVRQELASRAGASEKMAEMNRMRELERQEMLDELEMYRRRDWGNVFGIPRQVTPKKAALTTTGAMGILSAYDSLVPSIAPQETENRQMAESALRRLMGRETTAVTDAFGNVPEEITDEQIMLNRAKFGPYGKALSSPLGVE